MLAGRNVGLFVGVLTMGGKRWRRNDPNEMTGKEGARGENEPTSFSPSPVQCKKPSFCIVYRLPQVASDPSETPPNWISSLDFFRDGEMRSKPSDINVKG